MRRPRLAPPTEYLPLPQVILEALAKHLREAPVADSGLIFTTEKGAPLNRTRFSASVWRPATQRAGLTGAVFHDLRHYYASLLIRHGESVKVVQARLGHATAAETLDTYRTSGRTQRTRRERRSTRFSALLRTPCGPTGSSSRKAPGQRVYMGRVGL